MATLVDKGKELMISALNTSGPVHIGWGTGGDTVSETDTSLNTEASEDRVSGTKSIVTTTKDNDTYQVVGEITADGSKTIDNAGLFTDTAANDGDLVVKGGFTGVPVDEGDKIEFTVKIQQTNV